MPEPREAHARLQRPAHWALAQVERAGWSPTRITWELLDGSSARWESRAARRRGRLTLNRDGELPTAVEAEPVTARRLVRLNAIAGVAFFLGGSLFAIAAALAQLDLSPLRVTNVTYLVGGGFFSLGGYVSVLQAVNSPTTIDDHASLSAGRWRWWRLLPRNLGWLSAFVLFVGTLFFAVSLVAAFASGLTARQANDWIWVPDVVGCVCFLVSGHLALLEVGHGKIVQRPQEFGWWIVAVNQIGSILFFVAGIAAFTRPATATVLDPAVVNWGTFLGAACFAVAGLMQLRERPATPAAGRRRASS